MSDSEMKLNIANEYRKKLCSCGCGKVNSESFCKLCYSKEDVLIGWRGTGDDDHFICLSCLKRLNKINEGKYYPNIL